MPVEPRAGSIAAAVLDALRLCAESGESYQPDLLDTDPDEKQIRRAIAHLRKSGFVIAESASFHLQEGDS